MIINPKGSPMEVFGNPDLVWDCFFRPNRVGELDGELLKILAGTTLKVYSRVLQRFMDWLISRRSFFFDEYELVNNYVNVKDMKRALFISLLEIEFKNRIMI